jgi:hypothetical protein
MSAIPSSRPVGQPLDADRQAALDHWRAEHGSGDAEELAASAEAATLATVQQTPEGPRFESASFGELVEFIRELPF